MQNTISMKFEDLSAKLSSLFFLFTWSWWEKQLLFGIKTLNKDT